MSELNSNLLTQTERFIADLGIKESKRGVKLIYVYWLYLNWCKDKYQEPLYRDRFFIEFSKYFRKYINHRYRYYFVTCDALVNMTEEEKWQVKIDTVLEHDETKRRIRRREKDKAKRREKRRLKKESVQQD